MNTADPTQPVPPAAHRREIRSFVLREGRMSAAQLRFLEAMMPVIGEPYHDAPVDWAARFGREAPLILEIGTGMGDATAQMVAAEPQHNFIAIEVHRPGIGNLCKLAHQGGLKNLRIVAHDAVEVLRDMIAPDTLAAIRIYFPDPWPKKRHHKRRLVQPPFVALAASRLRPGGILHCATDWQGYAEWMREALDGEPLLENTVGEGFAPRPDFRPLTRFEKRGLALGHGVWDLLYRRRAQKEEGST